MRCCICLVVTVLALISSAVHSDELWLSDAERQWLEKHPEIRLGVDRQWLPFEAIEQGNYQGIASDYMRLLEERLGIRLEVQQELNWSEVLQAAQQQQLDLLSAAAATPEREQYLLFTDPYLTFPMVIIARDTAPVIQQLNDLINMRVGVVENYFSHETLKTNHPELTLITFASLEAALQAVSLGEIDVFVGNLASVSYSIGEQGLSNLKVAADTPYQFRLSMAVRKDWPELVGILNKALATIDQATHAQIQQNWIQLVSEESMQLKTYLLFALIVIGLIILGLLGVLFWNTELRVEIKSRQKAEQALRRSENRLLNSQQISGVGSWEWQADRSVMLWTDETYSILGIDPNRHKPAYSTFIQQIYSEDRVRVERGIIRSINTGQMLEEEFRVCLEGHRIRHIRCQGQPDLQHRQIAGSLQDITADKLIEIFYRGMAEKIAGTTGDIYFNRIVTLLAETFSCAYAFIGLLDKDDPAIITTRSVYAEGEIAENFSYPLADTPCEQVIGHAICIYKQGVQHKFPKDELLEIMGVNSYAGIPLFDGNGRCYGLLGLMDKYPLNHTETIRSTLQIASSRIVAELQRQFADRQLQLTASVFENTREGIIVADAESRIVMVNKGFCDITGFSSVEAVGMTPEQLFSSGHHDDLFYQEMWASLNSAGSWQGEIWNRRKNGEVFPALQSIERVTDEQGEVLQFISVFSDITEKKADEERIQYLAHYDLLTGLPNRVLFQDRLKHALTLAQRHQTRVGVAFVDLDRFKFVNDTLGHHMGDLLLQKVAQRLESVMRGSDTLSRLGGDEFTIIMEDFDRSEVLEKLARKLMHALADPIDLEGNQVAVNCSIGLSQYPEHGDDAELLLKSADIAMYHAKDKGRNRYAVYDHTFERNSYQHFQLENELRQAIEDNQLVLHYQPQMSLVSGRIERVEALVRWQKDDQLVPPDTFIPLAEESGLIVPLGRWVLLQACNQASCWHENGMPVRVAVNVSAGQLSRSDMFKTVSAALQQSGLAAEYLELEVTESYIMQHIDEVADTLNQLRSLGVSISIDDFGTGYSSLSYLKKLPIDSLKIDRSFIRDIPQDKHDEEIAAAIIAMAKQLGLKVVAEGVETEAQLEFLQQRHCDLVQGYYIARPAPADKVTRWMGNYMLQQA